MILVVADTNVALSGLLWPGPAAELLRAAARGECCILATDTMMHELESVMLRGKFSGRFRELGATADDALTFYRNLVRFCAAPARARVACADPNDRMFTDLAFSRNAHLLVAGDAHLLALKQTGHTPVVTAAHALEVLKRLRPPVEQ